MTEIGSEDVAGYMCSNQHSLSPQFFSNDVDVFFGLGWQRI